MISAVQYLLGPRSSKCFFNDPCQSYAKGIGLSLDDILGDEIQPNKGLQHQSLVVKLSSAMTIIIGVTGLFNSAFSFLALKSKASRRTGCGMYLLTSSVISLLTVSMSAFKFWSLFLIQTNAVTNQSAIWVGCIAIEPILKLLVNVDTWLHACVAVERAITVSRGVNFDKEKSKRIARWTIPLLPLIIMATTIHEPLFRKLVKDEQQGRSWCVAQYSTSVQQYNTFIIFVHFLAPFCANFFSALFIIFGSARQRSTVRRAQTYREHVYEQLREHRRVVISPLVLVALASPRLIISLVSGCIDTSQNPWWHFSSYFMSFIPSVIVFVLYVLPSQLYKREFNASMTRCQQRICRQ